jgi:hypothetical protein
MRAIAGAIALCFICCCQLAAAPTTLPADVSTIPRDELAKLDATELAGDFPPQDSSKLASVHGLIEDYFANGTFAGRKRIAGQIEKLGLDPAVVGRLTRLRTHWPVLSGGTVYNVDHQRGTIRIRYFFGVPPGYNRDRSWPLVVHLPSEAELAKVRTEEEAAAFYKREIEQELARHSDAVVLMPRLEPLVLFGPGYDGMNDALLPIFDIPEHVNVDPAQVYLVGAGDAAYAIWNLALLQPTYFAAVNPLAGGADAIWQRVRLMNLCNVMPVIWQDAQDPLVKPAATLSLVNALRIQGINFQIIQTDKLGHVPSDNVLRECYEKFRDRVRPLYPILVRLQSTRPETAFNRADWIQIWQPEDPGAEHRIYFRHEKGFMLVDENPWRVEAKLDANRITVATDNVESFRIFLNDRMVDFHRPVTVMVNNRKRFEGIVPTIATEMLQDQLLLGRGWRYFCGRIDIEPPPTATAPAKP